MCMQNVNAIARLYTEVETGNDPHRISVFKNQFDIISVKFDKENTPYIGDFYIVSEINLLGTGKEANKKFDIIEQKKRLDLKLELLNCQMKKINNTLGT